MIIQLRTVVAAALFAALFNATAASEEQRHINEYEAGEILKYRASEGPLTTLEGRQFPVDFSNGETLDTYELDEIYGDNFSQKIYNEVLKDHPAPLKDEIDESKIVGHVAETASTEPVQEEVRKKPEETPTVETDGDGTPVVGSESQQQGSSWGNTSDIQE